MRVAIAGAGAVGRSIAGELLENGHEVLLIDKDPRSIAVDSVPRAEWLLADACEITSLDEAALERCNVVIAATGDDKASQGWTPIIVDTNGDGKRSAYVEANQPLDPSKDKRVMAAFYGVQPIPIDDTIWGQSMDVGF